MMGRKSKNYSSRELEEGRNFTCEVYFDSYDLSLLFNRLDSFFSSDSGNSWFYILHDRDTYSELDYERYKGRNGEPPSWNIGDTKKAHCHIIGCLKNPSTLGAVSTKFGVESNYVQRVGSLKKMVRYLIHADNPEKTQYGLEEIITNAPEYLNKAFNGVEDGLSVTDKARIVIEFIQCYYNLKLSDITFRLIDLGVYDEFRRGQHLYLNMIKEERIGI